METLEQLAAVIVTAGLVAGNFLLFTPWRNGVDPRERHRRSAVPCFLLHKSSAVVALERQHPDPEREERSHRKDDHQQLLDDELLNL
ncbi:MAG: hypothetical protein ACPHAS_01140 [Synechococcus sp.]